jgi:anaerobic magnesium-protoporphyrin IX monomethyl ester cyclase
VRVLLLNPPGTRIYFRDGYCSTSSKSGYCWHPLDLLVQSGILSARGHQVAFIDAIAQRLTPEAVLTRIAAFRPGLILGLAGDASWPEDVRFYRRLAAQMPKARLILSGDVPRFEPERTFREIPKTLATLSDFTTGSVADVCEGAATGPGLTTPDGVTIPSDDRRWSAPSARHDLLPMGGYRLPFHGGSPFASVLASYGCPFSCTFCNTGMLGYKLRPAEETVAELRLVRDLGYRRVYIRDATANGHRRHWLETCRAITRARLDLSWNVFCTFQPFDAELAQAMADAGCKVVQFGIETDSDELRAQTGKAFKNEAAYAAVRYAHEAGMSVCGHFVLGLPGQSAEEVRRTALLARNLELDYASFNLAAARPGTTLRDTADADGLTGGDASIDGFAEGLADLSRAELRRLKRSAVLGFYLRPRPLRAIIPDLRNREGWAHLFTTARAASRTI